MRDAQSFYLYRPAAHFTVSDEDAADFLQSQFSNDLRPFEPGRCTYGLWLDVKGKVIADSVVLCEGAEQFRVLSAGCVGDRITAHLERHIIADDVALESCEPGEALELGASGVRALGLEIPAFGSFVRIDGGVLFSIRDGWYTLLLETTEAADAFRRKLIEGGFEALSESKYGQSRIAAGIPLVPDEIGETDLPGEGELTQDAVSLTKGCYLGQEVVARMHNIGKPQRRLFVVQGRSLPSEVPCALYNGDGKKVGELRTAYLVETHWLGVALLKTRFAESGSELSDGANALRVGHPLREVRDDG